MNMRTTVVLLLTCLTCLGAAKPHGWFGGRTTFTEDVFTEQPPAQVNYPTKFATGFNLGGPQVTISNNVYLASLTAPYLLYTGSEVTEGHTLYPPVSGTEATLLSTGIWNPNGGQFIVSGLAYRRSLVYFWATTPAKATPLTVYIQSSCVASNWNPAIVPGWRFFGPYECMPSNGVIRVTTSAALPRLAGLGILQEIPNLLPSVVVTSPANGATIAWEDPINLAATAKDPDGTVVQVDYWLDGSLVATTTNAPWTNALTGGLAGVHSLYATATDDRSGTTMSPAIQFTVSPPVAPNLPPTVALTSPTNNQVFQSTYATNPPPLTIILLSATPVDTDGYITNVTWYAGSSPVASTSSIPWTASWSALAGNYTLLAVATDNQGAKGTSSPPTSILVTNLAVPVVTNKPPTVAFVYPPVGSSFMAPADVSVTLTASDQDGTVASVQLWQDGVSKGTDTTAPYQFMLNNLGVGVYTLTAQATDNLGTNSSITSLSFNVTESPNVPPQVTITEPTNNASFTAPVNIVISATASDSDGTIYGVEFYRGATLLGISGTAPYSITNTGTTHGDFVFTATAIDNDGARSSDSVTVHVTDTPPTVFFTAPTNNATFSGLVNIGLAATASDPDGTVSNVKFYRNTTLINTDSSAPYSYTDNNVGRGDYIYSAVATDDGNLLATNRVTVHVLNQPPLVMFTAPTNNASFTSPVDITLTANASDVDGTVASVVFYRGSTLVATIPAAPYTTLDAGITNGTYTYKAVATDDAGSKSTNSITVIVQSPPPVNVPPTVAFTAPTNGASFTGPLTVPFVAAATDSDGTVFSVQFYRGTTLVSTDTTSPYQASEFLPVGYYIYYAVATDNLGAKATNSVAFTVMPANVPPTITITVPTNNVTFTNPVSITITATAADSDGTISGVAFYRATTLLTNDTAAPYSVVDATVPIGNYVYSAVATDNSNARATNQVTVHVVAAANIPPTVVFTVPTNGVTIAAPSTVTLTVTATDSDGSISNVMFYRGTTLLNTDASAPYSYTTGTNAAGDYTFYAVAQDNAGGKATNSVSVHLVNPPDPLVNAGTDFTVQLPATATLNGLVQNVKSNSWSKLSGPGTVTFSDSTLTNSDAVFSTAGSYTLRLTGYGTNSVATDDVIATVLAVPLPPADTNTVVVTPTITDVVQANPFKAFGAWVGSTINRTTPQNLAYDNWVWKDVEPSSNNYAWASKESGWAADLAAGRKMVIRINSATPGAAGHSDIPAYVAAKITMRPYSNSSGDGLCPDWDDSDFIADHDRLVAAFAARYDNDPRIAFIDLGAYGFWGEWHVLDTPGLAATAATRQHLAQSYITAFQNKKLMMPYDDTTTDSYVLARGVGLRNDSLGNPPSSSWFLTQMGSVTPKPWVVYTNSVQGGEWRSADAGAVTWMTSYYPENLAFFTTNHLTAITGGNRTLLATTDPTLFARMQELYKTLGYEYGISRIVHTTNVAAGLSMTVAVTVTNKAVAPLYYNWPLEVSLCTPAGAVVTKTTPTTGSDPRAWLPGATSFTNTWTIPSGTTAGTYDLCFALLDPSTGNPGIRFQNNGRDSNGRYHLSTVTVGGMQLNGTMPVILDGVGQPRQTRAVMIAGVNTAQTNYLQLLIDHADPPGKISVSWNNGSKVVLNNANVNVLGTAKDLGGIYGAYKTMWIEIPMAPGTVTNGVFNINFWHNYETLGWQGTRRTVFNCMGFNVRNPSGTTLINTNTAFSWQSPFDGPDFTVPSIYQNDSSYSAGLYLINHKEFIHPNPALGDMGGTCNTCHTRTWQEMCNFSVPTPAIRGAAIFGGCSDSEAYQIASYVWHMRRTDTNYAPVANIWNSPYQPGPGLDSQPIQYWRGGSNLVLDKDADMFPYIFPAGVNYNRFTNTAPNAFNIREMPIAIRLPHLFDWFPASAPSKLWDFTNSQCYAFYPQLVGYAAAAKAAGYSTASMGAYQAAVEQFGDLWWAWYQAYRGGLTTASDVRKSYDVAVWVQLKIAETEWEFGLEDHPSSKSRESRTWY